MILYWIYKFCRLHLKETSCLRNGSRPSCWKLQLWGSVSKTSRKRNLGRKNLTNLFCVRQCPLVFVVWSDECKTLSFFNYKLSCNCPAIVKVHFRLAVVYDICCNCFMSCCFPASFRSEPIWCAIWNAIIIMCYLQ